MSKENNNDIFTKTKKLEERINELTFKFKSAKGIIDELLKEVSKEVSEKLRNDSYVILSSVYGRALKEAFEEYFNLKKEDKQEGKQIEVIGFGKYGKKSEEGKGHYS